MSKPCAQTRPRRGEPRGSHEQRRTATRGKVLDACVQCLFELGYQGTTATGVARRAGVSRGALLQQFPTRLDLMLAVVEHLIAQYHDQTEMFLQSLDSDTERFKALTDALWAKPVPHTMAMIEVYMASRSDPALARGLRGRVDAVLDQEFEVSWQLAQGAGIDDRSAVDALGLLTLASIWGLTVLRLGRRDGAGIERAYGLLKANRDNFIERLSTPRERRRG